jgi:hypothetical protein
VVGGSWAAPPDVARLCAEADKVLTFYSSEHKG